LEFSPYGLICLQLEWVSHQRTFLRPRLIKGGLEKIDISEQDWIRLPLWHTNFEFPGSWIAHRDQTSLKSHELNLLVRSNVCWFLSSCLPVTDFSWLKTSICRSKNPQQKPFKWFSDWILVKFSFYFNTSIPYVVLFMKYN
jgi:hypothetical protein